MDGRSHSLKSNRSFENIASLKKKASLIRANSASRIAGGYNASSLLRAQEALSFMQRETTLNKIHKGQREAKTVVLSEDKTQIRWKPTKKDGYVTVKNITEVITGKSHKVFLHKNVSQFCQDEKCCFTLKFSDRDPLHWASLSAEVASLWIIGIKALISFHHSKSVAMTGQERNEEREKHLRFLFDAESVSSGQLTQDQVIGLFQKLNENISSQIVKQKLKMVNYWSITKDTEKCASPGPVVDKTVLVLEAKMQVPDLRTIDFHTQTYLGLQDLSKKKASGEMVTRDEFVHLYKRLSTRPEISCLLVQYASNSSFLTTDDLLLFLEQEQGMVRVTKDQCLDLIYQYEHSKEQRKLGQIGIDGFTKYLMSVECDIFDPNHLEVNEADMHEPICHYFIASSHNTYLAEGQLYGKSDIQQYIDVLLKGCRCIELDCWDGVKEPIITHGGTVTSSILFRDVIKTINTYAFEASKYPLVLSIENHCHVEQQRMMAQIMAEEFKDKLCSEFLEDETSITELPSPAELMGKICLKGKKLPKMRTKSDGFVSDDDEDSSTENKKKKDGKGEKSHALAKELSDQINYFSTRKFKNFHTSLDHQEVYEMCSLAEKRAEKLIKDSPEEFVNHNKRFISRIYPDGLRVTSSNFNPHFFWNVGCQMVAMNYQKSGVEMDLNHGMFLKNGACGYILKPSVLRDSFSYFNPENVSCHVYDDEAQIIKIKVISGQLFSQCKNWADNEDVYVSVTVSGIPADKASQKLVPTPHDGYSTLFTEETFEFHVKQMALALVRFEVKSVTTLGDGKFLAQYTIPFDCIRPGYRHVFLKDEAGKPIDKCSLFVHVAVSNKKGGGNLKKNKSKETARNYPSMKTVGVKDIDETFKIAIKPLREAADLVEDFQQNIAEFKEGCDLSPTANVKQCIRFLATRIKTTVNRGELWVLQCSDNQIFSELETSGSLPNNLENVVNFFNIKLMESCRNLIGTGGKIHQQLLHCMRAGMEWHEDLEDVCHKKGIKDRKFDKAMKNFGWNLNLLKGQAEKVLQKKKECHEYLLQIQEVAITSDLLKVESKEE